MIAAIPSPATNDLNVGPLEFHAYGLIYGVAIIIGTLITIRRWEAQGGSGDLVLEVVLWSVPAGLIGGRIYFDLTSSGEVPPHWWGPFAIWDGGLGSWGAFSAAVLVAVWRLRRRGASVSKALDAAAPAFLVAQGIGRFANYVNQELFGGPSNLPWAVEIDPSHRPPGYEHYSSFQPTNFYESIWDFSFAPSSSGSATTAASVRRAFSPSMSPATRPSGSSRSSYGSTPPTTSSACGSTSLSPAWWRSPAPPGSPGPRDGGVGENSRRRTQSPSRVGRRRSRGKP